MEVANDLRDRLLDAEELILEEVVDLDGLVLVETLGDAFADVGSAYPLDRVEDAGVGEPGNGGVFLEDFQVIDQGAAPDFALTSDAVFLDHALEGAGRVIHQRPPSEPARVVESAGSPRQRIRLFVLTADSSLETSI